MRYPGEVVLPRRAVPQPSPAIVKGGDCTACCLAAVTGLSVQDCYGLVEDERLAGGGLTWEGVRRALIEAERRGLIDDCVTTTPMWVENFYPAHMMWGLTAVMQGGGWLDYLRLAFTAGFYALTHIDYAGRGPYESGDHFVLLCGVRERLEPVDNEVGRKVGARAILREVLVSCSASGERWIGANEFLKTRGGFAVLLAKPRSEG